MTVEIEVTEEDIRLGSKTPTSNICCPIARALKRAGFKQVSVGVESGTVKGVRVTFPKKVASFIMAMCYERAIKPFSFTLSVPAA
jgi:hypothetical protein